MIMTIPLLIIYLCLVVASQAYDTMNPHAILFSNVPPNEMYSLNDTMDLDVTVDLEDLDDFPTNSYSLKELIERHRNGTGLQLSAQFGYSVASPLAYEPIQAAAIEAPAQVAAVASYPDSSPSSAYNPTASYNPSSSYNPTPSAATSAYNPTSVYNPASSYNPSSTNNPTPSAATSAINSPSAYNPTASYNPSSSYNPTPSAATSIYNPPASPASASATNSYPASAAKPTGTTSIYSPSTDNLNSPSTFPSSRNPYDPYYDEVDVYDDPIVQMRLKLLCAITREKLKMKDLPEKRKEKMRRRLRNRCSQFAEESVKDVEAQNRANKLMRGR